ncbi:hypothetical protein [Aquimarina sediminis]|uniref:hypothetical protein n=1 Tax=Aquimarina sediminis TaxID=2070536 RepID=UPI000CA041B9|nr:hypothetical protein [Aquimarina sediminis]
MNIVSFLLLISAFQGFIFGFVILFSPFFKSKTNNYLGYSILVLSLLMFNMFFSNIGFFDSYPYLRIIDDIEWVFLFPVTIFFYFVLLLNFNIQSSKWIKCLYIPIGISITLKVFYVLEEDYEFFSIISNNADNFYFIAFEIEKYAYYIFNILLLTFSFVFIKKSTPFNDKEPLKWAFLLWSMLFILTLIWIVLSIVESIWDAVDSQVVISILAVEVSFFL